MGKLTAMKPRLGALPSRVSRHRDAEGHSRTLEPWRAWYNTKEWQEVRQAVFLRDRFTCQCGCGTLILDKSELVGDHIDEQDKRTRETFMDRSRVQTLWKPHHDGWKQRLERRARSRDASAF